MLKFLRRLINSLLSNEVQWLKEEYHRQYGIRNG